MTAISSKTKAMKALAARFDLPDTILGMIWPPSGETLYVDDIEEFASVMEVNVERDAVVQFIKELGKAGYGEFIIGRRGYKTRFEWSLDSLELANLYGENAIESKESHTIEHSFVLREDFRVTLKLPSDLSTTEASRLASFISSIPFE